MSFCEMMFSYFEMMFSYFERILFNGLYDEDEHNKIKNKYPFSENNSKNEIKNKYPFSENNSKNEINSDSSESDSSESDCDNYIFIRPTNDYKITRRNIAFC